MAPGKVHQVTYGERRIAVLALVVATLACMVFAFAKSDAGTSKASAAVEEETTTVATREATVSGDPTSVDTAVAALTGDVEGAEDPSSGSCNIGLQFVRPGATGDSVVCIQNALIAAGLYSGTASGTFDDATANAVRKLQTSKDMFVDGVVGRETAISLGIWPPSI